jgi:hypothetical protein
MTDLERELFDRLRAAEDELARLRAQPPVMLPITPVTPAEPLIVPTLPGPSWWQQPNQAVSGTSTTDWNHGSHLQ